ncbi:MAG: hypothetical protein AB7S78_09280 [Candidatus Omnitrophota bacterium]
MKKSQVDLVRFYEQLEFWKEEAPMLGLRTTDLQRLKKRKKHKYRRSLSVHI